MDQRTTGEGWDQHEQLDWTTELDAKILDVLSTKLTLSPKIISENIEESRVSVSRRLNSLTAGDLVEKVDRGRYRITWDGMDFLRGDYGDAVPKGGLPVRRHEREHEYALELIESQGREAVKDEYNLNDEHIDELLEQFTGEIDEIE